MRTIKLFSLLVFTLLISFLTSCTKDQAPKQEAEQIQIKAIIDFPAESLYADLNITEEWDLSKDALAFLNSDFACDLSEEEINEISRSSSVTFFRQFDWVDLNFTDILGQQGSPTGVLVEGESTQAGFASYLNGTAPSLIIFSDLLERQSAIHSTSEVLYNNEYELYTFQEEDLTNVEAMDLNTKVRVFDGNGIFSEAKGRLNRRVIPEVELGINFMNWSSLGVVPARVIHNGWISADLPN